MLNQQMTLGHIDLYDALNLMGPIILVSLDLVLNLYIVGPLP